VAGTIAQAAGNGKGVVGVAPKATILPVRVLDANGSGSNTWVASGIIWAVDNGANIINMSLGGPVSSEVVADACQYAYEQGVTIIAATGNDGFTDFIGYPAAYPSTIAVGSVNPKKGIAFYSNQGKEIDLVAPGGDTTVDTNNDGMADGVVQETLQGGTWNLAFMQGTSMATPHVAGVAALVYANGVTDPDEIRKALNSTADDLGGKGWDTAFGNGLVNPVAALAYKGRGKVASKLQIVNPEVRALSSTRAVVTWETTAPGSSMLKGTDGTKEKTMHSVTHHKVTVSGKTGQKVTYTFGSKAGDKRASAKLSHTF
jgi:serine protease